jgi:KDO2-lipid IV(A) lauroyltransferase
LKINDAFIKKYVHIEGMDYFHQAVKENNGVIVLSAHIGNYELGAAVASRMGHPLYVIAMPHENKKVDDFFNSQRDLFNLKVISTGISVKRCVRLLREGKSIALLGDRRFSRDNGIAVPFCGRQVLLPQGPAFFAIKTGALIVPSFFIRERKYYYRLVFEEPIRPQAQDPQGATQEIISRYGRILEEYIRKFPEQWYIFENFWNNNG